MFQVERKIVDRILRNKNILFFIVVSILAAGVRVSYRAFLSIDMCGCLLPWFQQIKDMGGFSALRVQTGDYNILYQFVICIFTYLPFNPVYMYKAFSIVFDFLLAFAAGTLAAKIQNEKIFDKVFNVTYFIVIMCPTVAMNSALWGQCDSIYTFFLVMTLICLFNENNIKAFIFYGVAFAFKLQAVFLLPFLIIYYFYKKNFSIVLFGIPVAIVWLSGIPGFIFGRSLLAPFQIYFFQAGEHKSMWMNSISIWRLVGANYEFLSKGAILLTIGLMGVGLYSVIIGRFKLDNKKNLIRVAIWCIWTSLLFLPAMHERYTYPMDILFILLSISDRKYVKYAVVEILVSLWTYGRFLFSEPETSIYAVLAIAGLWISFTMDMLKEQSE